MSLFNNLHVSNSGLGVSSTSMSVIGDNISNINTVGYKASQANFADFVPNTVGGMGGVSQLGNGAGMSTIAVLFGQGAIEDSSNALDMAISGSGFFMVNDADKASYYTRSGNYYLNDDGTIVNAQGLELQGYTAEDGALSATVSSLTVDPTPIAQSASTLIEIAANLDSEADDSTTPLGSGTFVMDGVTDTVNDVADAADFSSSVTVYDSLGQAHDVTLLFEKTGSNSWDWYAVVDGAELNAGFTAGNAWQISSGSMSFNTDGTLSTFSQTDENALGNTWEFLNAASMDFDFQFGVDAAGDATGGEITQSAGDSAVSAVAQDGYAAADLYTLEIDTDGTIYGTYSNGEELVMGQVLLANFTSETGLDRLGGNLYAETIASGEPAVGVAGTGGRGDIYGYAVENSNVELEDEFVSMITAQRTYQANSRVLSSTNELLQELVNLV